jgi:DNA repair protein RecO (recombination protein O)
MRNVFMIKVLALSGFRPHFDSCLSCGTRLTSEAFFSLKKGGLLCRKCLASDFSSVAVLPGTIASILYIERSSWADCLRLKLMPGVRRQLEEILHCFVHFHVGRALKTRSKIHEILDL